mmetsp:Transcript_1358/g.1851  ORF Transcript_1358/g.1851 Transcript_1358/m.1851 type:complete len:270 (-) Transcript_1358:134-943(-)|eukprot:CAMPEP_0113937656 /NCGR_PEP_ID=MMETSP1339-20121228/4230_1 /TAXON_ID=94617 /ORGANISM="Fibrocapsa japonica" /LENGTH=269 /DNA_ID=CAMNT_0000940503 /DNA_START=111 /DNA_END=920 /DNA_ORIENTATION=+ /assembly_acc=CAM_ASM_000762
MGALHLFFFLALTLICHTHAKKFFGVDVEEEQRKREGKGSFEELQDIARQMQDGSGGLEGLADMFGGVDMDGLFNTPELQELFNNPDKVMDIITQSMEELKNDPETMQELLKANPLLQGNPMVDELLQDPQKIAEAMDQFTDIVKNPEKLSAIYDDMFKDLDFDKLVDELDPKAMELLEQLGTGDELAISKTLEEMLSDPIKIEEGRQTLLQNPEMLKDPMMQAMYGTEDLESIVNDPVKWGEMVDKAKDDLMGMLQPQKQAAEVFADH